MKIKGKVLTYENSSDEFISIEHNGETYCFDEFDIEEPLDYTSLKDDYIELYELMKRIIK